MTVAIPAEAEKLNAFETALVHINHFLNHSRSVYWAPLH